LVLASSDKEYVGNVPIFFGVFYEVFEFFCLVTSFPIHLVVDFFDVDKDGFDANFVFMAHEGIEISDEAFWGDD
jgi:hypothetical protein